MRSERGYSLVEMLVTVGMIGVISAIAVPVFLESNSRNAVWTAAEQIGSTVRQARLKAISANTTYRVAFNCPGTNELRALISTGDPDVDAEDELATRCADTYEGDTGAVELPSGVSFDVDDATSLQVSGRGVFTANGATIPLTITVTNGSVTRLLSVSQTGQITFSNVE